MNTACGCSLPYHLRPATEADYDFLWHVTSTTMLGYVDAIWGWNKDWQVRRFRDNFSAGSWRVILVDDYDAGGLQAGHRPSEGDLFIANIQLLPIFQRHGIGSAIIRDLMNQAYAMGMPLTLNVLRSNPAALRLYERLGLIRVGENKERFFLSTSYKTEGTSLSQRAQAR